MALLSSLRNRIFTASAALAVLSIGFAVYIVNVKVSNEAERQLQRGLEEAGTLLEQHRATLVGTFTLLARTIADLPKLKAAVATDDAPTVEPIAIDYHGQVKSDLFVVTNRDGRILASVGLPDDEREGMGRQPAIRRALGGSESSAFWADPRGVLQVVTVPIAIGRPAAEILGSLSVGFLLDNDLASQFKAITDSEIAFADGNHVLAGTLDARHRALLGSLLSSRGVSNIRIDNDDYVGLVKPLKPMSADTDAGGRSTTTTGTGSATSDFDTGPTAILLRSRSERLKFLSTIHATLAVAALVAVLMATLVSYGVARTVTRPLAAITAGMGEIATTGDLTRKIALEKAGDWDEDARLLATTFNTLTDSIAAFQREAAQRERLSSLGRLSTIIAHEIRNPLMIIKATSRNMQRDGATSLEIKDGAADIDEEVGRLNRVVTDVLDFARPLRFEYAEADLNVLGADLATAMNVTDRLAQVHFHPDPAVPRAITDSERLRVALVNVLTNAREAVAERTALAAARTPAGAATGDPAQTASAVLETPEIELRTELVTTNCVAFVVRDRGIGIEAGDAARAFEPYFTTKRAGTGLGLAIAKNIIEGLGGTITIGSSRSMGTEIRIELPRDSRPPSESLA